MKRGLEARLGYRFRDPALLERALTHASFGHEVQAPDYERLEFLGDAVLAFVVAERMYRADPEATEGDLTRRKQSVVRAEALAEAARRIGLGDALRLGKGEESTGGRTKASLLADAFEAVLGAVDLDGGIRSARAFVNRHLGREMGAVLQAKDVAEDYKTRLQEWAQARWRVTPRYRIVSASGPAHAQEFVAEVLVEDSVIGEGAGRSRKQAEQQAARAALRGLR